MLRKIVVQPDETVEVGTTLADLRSAPPAAAVHVIITQGDMAEVSE
jgi:hypothetical protein